MEILKASEYKASHEPLGTYITISLTGIVALNSNVMRLLNVAHEDRVLIAKDKAGDYFIGKAKSKDSTDAFKLREYNKTKSLQFNAKGLINELIRTKDLALSPEKRKSMRLNILQDSSQKVDGIQFYEIETT